MRGTDADRERMLLTLLIQERLFAFGSAVDSKQFPRLSEAFASSASGDYGQGRGHRSCDELIQSMEQHLGAGSNCGPSQHNILNVRVFVAPDDGVESQSNFYAVHEGVGRLQGQIWSTWGQYNDSWVSTVEGWRIQHRRYVTFFSAGPADIVGRD
ncbi:nuclear transport factor 2 family protein [Denitratisoma oestradiolicum]|uniref:Uncharacterized protein n=1 Tax=Denitratisoma oestradiolicum TaxID=311182 RepID=A0A6S6YRW9_9PROT|nr:nuclear transport factor 2 family protein [Denitratisoma oestradiolicum]TWO79664.1 hypothetical protein CBW56_13910 [Denitratisoma oestradiolicum]CAB1370472.1 conserved protein of unknown function [Denitratisoma oestradiolicum]